MMIGRQPLTAFAKTETRGHSAPDSSQGKSHRIPPLHPTKNFPVQCEERSLKMDSKPAIYESEQIHKYLKKSLIKF